MEIQHDDLPSGSRYREVSRRLFLRRAAQAAGVLAVFPILTSCGEDKTVFSATTTTVTPTTQTARETTTQTQVTTTTVTTTTAPPKSGAGSMTGEAVIAFSYTASAGGGRVRNPYVAVWIEDMEGELVDTVALWFLQTQKGLRWVSDLRRWYSVDGSTETIDAVSSATRRPGDYSVVWDLTDVDGAPVAAGEYYLCIESAREHGPYSLIRESVLLEPGARRIALTDDGELHDAVLSLSA